jgi:hypothetical protein
MDNYHFADITAVDDPRLKTLHAAPSFYHSGLRSIGCLDNQLFVTVDRPRCSPRAAQIENLHLADHYWIIYLGGKSTTGSDHQGGARGGGNYGSFFERSKLRARNASRCSTGNL